MEDNKILYAITLDDVENISETLNISFEYSDLEYIEEKIGEFLGSKWSDAIEYALNELKNKK
ncbi:MAG: hypothetical protein JXL97_05840 [Bacteroidales bacterium]|nr:hypothetical protein [Bacteroidales bacterium]